MFRPSDQRVLAGVTATLSATFRDQDGEPTSPGTVTVEVVSEASGTVVLAAGTATVTPTDATTRTVALSPAQTASLDRLVCTWTDSGTVAATTYVEIVGGYWASVAELRDGDEKIQSGTRFSNDLVIAVRKEAEDFFEDRTNTAWVPRYAWARVDGTGSCSLGLPHPYVRRIRSVRSYSDATTYTAWTAPQLASVTASPSGVVERTDGGVWDYGRQNLLVEFEHGTDRPPHDLSRAFARFMRAELAATKSAIPDRATSFQSGEGGTYSLTTPGRNGSISGIPKVDEVLVARKFHQICIA